MKSEMLCEHPNENPNSCPCAWDCYCRAHHCNGKTVPPYREAPPAAPIEDMNICARCKRADCKSINCDGGASQPTTQPALMITVGDYKIKELVALGRNIWGNHRYRIDEIVVRLMVSVGDLSRLARSGEPQRETSEHAKHFYEMKKELGNIVLSTLRWCDDLGFDVTECLALAIEAQRKFAQSGKPR